MCVFLIFEVYAASFSVVLLFDFVQTPSFRWKSKKKDVRTHLSLSIPHQPPFSSSSLRLSCPCPFKLSSPPAYIYIYTSLPLVWWCWVTMLSRLFIAHLVRNRAEMHAEIKDLPAELRMSLSSVFFFAFRFRSRVSVSAL